MLFAFFILKVNTTARTIGSIRLSWFRYWTTHHTE